MRTPLALAEREPARARRPLCAFLDGFSLHAATFVAAADRAALERLARYLLRPAISADRVAVRPDGRVEYRFRRPDPTGRAAWVTDGPTLCRRLATLIPPRRSHVVRYHGVFSSAHRLRERVLPAPGPDDDPAAPVTASMLARRLDWAALLERVFGADVTTCPRCAGPSPSSPSSPSPTSPPASSTTSASPPPSRPSPPPVVHRPTTSSR